jgi:hypothetical protein
MTSTSPNVLSRNRLGVATRRGVPEEIEAARRDLAATKIEQYIRKVVDEAPPLTNAQRDRLAVLLRGGRDCVPPGGTTMTSTTERTVDDHAPTVTGARTNPADCQPSCWARGEGHTYVNSPDEQECWTSDPLSVEMSTAKWVEGAAAGEPSRMVPDHVNAYLWKVAGGPTTIDLDHDGRGPAMMFTPAEVRTLCAILLDLAEVAER